MRVLQLNLGGGQIATVNAIQRFLEEDISVASFQEPYESKTL